MNNRSEYTANRLLAEKHAPLVARAAARSDTLTFAVLVSRFPRYLMIAAPIAAVLVIAFGA